MNEGASLPRGDGGVEEDGGRTNAAGADASQDFFPRPYEVGVSATREIGDIHKSNGGPTTVERAGQTDCLTCHSFNSRRFIVAGVAAKPGIEIGVRLASGKFLSTTSATPQAYFAIEFPEGETLTGALVAVRDGTRESRMPFALPSGGCNAQSCHGGAQGLIFK